ncbi:MAG TPA: PDZ domain-containing protein [Bryobacteraceae bacterium]|jgi:S1-C subfamily serine protease|nr:PDZ domain-containing protein [Bryobacteraceae bacterium]
MKIFCLVTLTVLGLAAATAFAQDGRRVSSVVGIQHAGTSYLGIGCWDLTPERAKALKLKEEHGVEVKHVEENSPAAKAGLKESDVILEYNGTAVQGEEQLTRIVRETPAGHQVKLAIWRNGAPMDVVVTVGARKNTILETPDGPVALPTMPPMPPIEIPRFEMTWQNAMLGIEGESLGQHQQLAAYFGVTDGVLVKAVIKNSAAEKAGLKAGDVIVKVDGANVGSTREITSELRSLRSRKNVPLTVVRDKKEQSFSVNFDDNRGNPGAPGEK